MSPFTITEADGGITVDVVVVPRASREKLGPVTGDRLKIALTAPPVDGAANAALIALLAKTLRVPRAAITIVRGETGRRKTIRIGGTTAATLRDVIA